MKLNFVGWGPLCDVLVRCPKREAPAWNRGYAKPPAKRTSKIKP